MILEAMTAIAAAIGTFAIGAPIASKIAGPRAFGRTAPREETKSRHHAEVTQAFQPLDLGPDPMYWPSERPWELTSTLKDQQWPSKSWNDEHFGRHWRDGSIQELEDLGFHAMLRRQHAGEAPADNQNKASAQKAAQKAAAQKAAAQKQGQKQNQKQGQKQKAPKPAESDSRDKANAARSRQQSSSTDAERKQRQIALEQAKSAAAFFGVGEAEAPKSDPKAPPSAAEIDQLVTSAGLAGTVQVIMQRTGWDFREAAQYLARVRQKS